MLRAALPLALAAGAALAGDVPVIALASAAVDELSGLAVSRADAQVLWGHNDSGSGPYLFRFGTRGEDFGAARVPGASANDWEDLAAFEHAGRPALLIADTGNNFMTRGRVMLYAVSDPGRTGEFELLWQLPFRLPDGARDCEAVAVDPVDRAILLVTKRDTPPRLYRLPLPERTPPDVQQAEFLGELTGWSDPEKGRLFRHYAHSPTGLAVSRDGARAAVVTLSNAFVYRRQAGVSWAQALQQPVATLPLPTRALANVEAVAFSADGRELIVGSEGRPARLLRIALPQ